MSLTGSAAPPKCLWSRLTWRSRTSWTVPFGCSGGSSVRSKIKAEASSSGLRYNHIFFLFFFTWYNTQWYHFDCTNIFILQVYNIHKKVSPPKHLSTQHYHCKKKQKNTTFKYFINCTNSFIFKKIYFVIMFFCIYLCIFWSLFSTPRWDTSIWFLPLLSHAFVFLFVLCSPAGVGQWHHAKVGEEGLAWSPDWTEWTTGTGIRSRGSPQTFK